MEDSIQNLRETNAQLMVQHVVGARNEITGKRCAGQNLKTDQQKTSPKSRSKYSQRKNNEQRDVYDIRKDDTEDEDLFTQEHTKNISAFSAQFFKSRSTPYKPQGNVQFIGNFPAYTVSKAR